MILLRFSLIHRIEITVADRLNFNVFKLKCRNLLKSILAIVLEEFLLCSTCKKSILVSNVLSKVIPNYALNSQQPWICMIEITNFMSDEKSSILMTTLMILSSLDTKGSKTLPPYKGASTYIRVNYIGHWPMVKGTYEWNTLPSQFQYTSKLFH